MDFNLNNIVRVAYEAHRALAMSLGDFGYMPWDSAPAWLCESFYDSVKKIADTPDIKPWELHDDWKARMEVKGWKLGEMRAPEKLEHPKLVPATSLPKPEDTFYTALMIAVVKALLPVRMKKVEPEVEAEPLMKIEKRYMYPVVVAPKESEVVSEPKSVEQSIEEPKSEHRPRRRIKL